VPRLLSLIEAECNCDNPVVLWGYNQILFVRKPTRGWRLSAKGNKKHVFWYPAPKEPSLGRMAQTPRAGTGDFVGWFCRYWCSTLFNYDSNLSMCDTFLQKLIHLPDNRGLLATPKETYDFNVSAVTLSIWSFRTPTSIFGTKELNNPVSFWISLHPLNATKIGNIALLFHKNESNNYSQ